MKDDYPTCRKTFATLRIYHKEDKPGTVTRTLKIKPSSTQLAGVLWKRRGIERKHTISGWFLTSEDAVESYDSANHLRWLVAQLEGKAGELAKLATKGWWMDISCYWDSDSGHGGPTLDPELMMLLASLKIEVWFDVYFSGAMDYTQIIKRAYGAYGKEV